MRDLLSEIKIMNKIVESMLMPFRKKKRQEAGALCRINWNNVHSVSFNCTPRREKKTV